VLAFFSCDLLGVRLDGGSGKWYLCARGGIILDRYTALRTGACDPDTIWSMVIPEVAIV